MAPRRNVPAQPADDDDDGRVDPTEQLFDLGDVPNDPDLKWLIFRRRSRAEITADPRLNRDVYVGTYVGEMDLDRLREQVGGGSYDLRARIGGRFVARRQVDVDGPPRAIPLPAAAAPLLDHSLDARLSAIEQALTQGTTPAHDYQAGFTQALQLLHQLQPPAPPPTPMSEILGALRSGIEIGMGRDVEKPSRMDSILESLLPVVLAGAVGRPTPPALAPAPTPAAAAAAPAEPSPVSVAARTDSPAAAALRAHPFFGTTITLLCQAIADGLPPARAAAVVSAWPDDDVQLLAPLAGSDLAGLVVERRPDLETRAEHYCNALLQELFTDDESDPPMESPTNQP